MSEDRALPEKGKRLRSFMETGGQVVGQVAGAAVAVVAGPLVGGGAGALLGDVFSRVGLEMHDRLLARRQGARAAGALDVATVRVGERLEAGDELRDDGFFDPRPDGRADAEEVLEGTLLTAANSYEERKVPLVGQLYANLAFDPTVSPAHANYLLRVADRLTYRQLVILAFFAQAQSEKYEMAIVRLTADQGEAGSLPSPALIAEMNDLSTMRLLGLRQADGEVIAPQDAWGGGTWALSNLAQIALMPVAETLHRLMELNMVPSVELDAVLAELRGL